MRDSSGVRKAVFEAIEKISRQYLSFHGMTDWILVLQYYITRGIVNSKELTRMYSEKLLYLTLTTGDDVFQLHSHHHLQWLFQITPVFHHLLDPFLDADLRLLIRHDNIDPRRVRCFLSDVGWSQ